LKSKIVFPEKFVSETRNVFTNEILKIENNELLVGKVLATFPVAMLVCNN
jgi:maltooligosyltrehalose synthase